MAAGLAIWDSGRSLAARRSSNNTESMGASNSRTLAAGVMSALFPASGAVVCFRFLLRTSEILTKSREWPTNHSLSIPCTESTLGAEIPFKKSMLFPSKTHRSSTGVLKKFTSDGSVDGLGKASRISPRAACSAAYFFYARAPRQFSITTAIKVAKTARLISRRRTFRTSLGEKGMELGLVGGPVGDRCGA